MAEGKRSPKNKIAFFLLALVAVMLLALIAAPQIIYKSQHNPPPDVSVTPSTTPTTTIPAGAYGYGNSDGLAFVVDVTNEGPFMWDEDYWQTTTYSVYYDGTLEITNTYSLSGERTEVCHISETDFNSIMSLAHKVMAEKPYEDMDYSDTMDGSTWGFSIYDTNGEATYIYGGYTNGIEDLENIEGILISQG
ncbi:hypothetical protein SAMN06296952_1747 [Oscillospiraceae bacterium]|nr:hypothetical protein SAMN06296952_1747 [Oscillospiraceae bacterium]